MCGTLKQITETAYLVEGLQVEELKPEKGMVCWNLKANLSPKCTSLGVNRGLVGYRKADLRPTRPLAGTCFSLVSCEEKKEIEAIGSWPLGETEPAYALQLRIRAKGRAELRGPASSALGKPTDLLWVRTVVGLPPLARAKFAARNCL